MGILILLHIAGFAAWMGAGFASMVIGISGRSEDRATQGAIARLQTQLQRRLIAPGAALAVLTGVALTARVMKAGVPPSAWLMLMQGAGLLAAALVFFVTLPTASRINRLDPTGQNGPAFDALRKRMAVAGSIAGTLGILALVGGVFSKY
jgi:hypothetical protein